MMMMMVMKMMKTKTAADGDARGGAFMMPMRCWWRLWWLYMAAEVRTGAPSAACGD